MVEGDKPQTRNAHRDFMIDLAAELITGKWRATVQDEGLFYADTTTSSTPSTPTSASASTPATTPSSPGVEVCKFVLSSEQFPDATRGKRGCKVCRFEGRYLTVKTNYCLQHNVCLCSGTYPINPGLSDIVCPHEDWSCWRKFHEYYVPNGLFNRQGRILRGSSMNKARRQLTMESEESPATPVMNEGVASSRMTEGVERSAMNATSEDVESAVSVANESVESPATLVVSPFVATDESEVSFQEYVPEQHPNTPAFSSTSIDFAS